MTGQAPELLRLCSSGLQTTCGCTKPAEVLVVCFHFPPFFWIIVSSVKPAAVVLPLFEDPVLTSQRKHDHVSNKPAREHTFLHQVQFLLYLKTA